MRPKSRIETSQPYQDNEAKVKKWQTIQSVQETPLRI